MNNKTNQSYHHGNLKNELLQVARDVLEKKGLDKVTIREIAREVGVSHTAPQRHFKNRQALLDSLALMGFNELGEGIRESQLADTTDFAERLNNAALSFAHFATRNGQLFELMISSKHTDKTGDIPSASEKAFFPILDLIIDGQKNNMIQDGDSARIGLNLYATLLGITTMVNGGLIDSNKLDELVVESTQHFLRGFQP
ncbi:TetR/AcrR family transcriptional regulator [Enterococcus sp. SMC-9]|uniref:TetR/AcrR family transcriptional regulator n=1 Tax=Enterococcus sp. SMC-9 TaxID=2862343 RepID=UPI001E301F23|nr:TetR/AcrR family transcriptional regulator [Enterococcus sp. SMC-9]MCD1023975.1 TetR/AcrR family transcriptional regulator [Enterococcus sp. SMC-9]